MNRAIFLDRDGTVIADKGYLGDTDGIEFLPGVLSALRAIQDAGFLLIMVSNQSGIGRGYFTENDYDAVQKRLDELLKSNGVKFTEYYHCPHLPEDNCVCRKPEPYFALKASAEFGISLQNSYMVGDKQSDIEFGKNFGAKGCFFNVRNLVENLALLYPVR